MRRDPWRAWRRVYAIAVKEATHIRRDARVMYLAIGMPVLLILLFGYGVSFDIHHVPVAIVDQDHTVTSRAVARSLVASQDLELHATPASVVEAQTLIRQGRVAAAFVLPQGLDARMSRGETVPLQMLVDGSDANSATQVLAKADGIGRATSMKLANLTVTPPLSVRVWTRYNPTGESALFLVPGLVAYVLAMVAVLLTALSVAREWERGSMEQLFATPVGRLEIVVGKLLPYLLLGYIQTLLVLAAGAAVFGMPIRGLPLVLFTAGLFLLGMLGQGLLISVLTRNQMVATQLGTFSSLLPSMLLSGFLFPVDNMPLPLRVLSNIVPARWFIAALRGILLKGNGFMDVWFDLFMLAAFATLMIALSTARFQRRVA